jgi:hypothetical protein
MSMMPLCAGQSTVYLYVLGSSAANSMERKLHASRVKVGDPGGGTAAATNESTYAAVEHTIAEEPRSLMWSLAPYL